MTQLYEEYRPGKWDDVVGQDKAVKVIHNLTKRGLGGRAFWISGKSGTGKTTIGKLIASEIADDWTTVEEDASNFTPKAASETERRMRCMAIGDKGGHAVIINESHGLRRDTIRQLLVTLERIPKHVVWIFTTTNEGQDSLFEDHIDAHPLLSRCQCIALQVKGLKTAFARRCQEIAELEELGGKSATAYEALAEECKCNMREMLQKVEAGDMLQELGAFEELMA